MRFLSLLVFTNLFLLPIFFHPFNVSRHFIHIGHEPFQPKPLPRHSFEASLYHIVQNPRSYIPLYLSVKKPSPNLLQRIYEYLFHTSRSVPDGHFYPNLFQYTRMYITDHDLSPFTQSFLTMYIAYFLLTYLSSLVHVYRMPLKPKQDSSNEIRDCARRWIQASYVRWMAHAVAWKLLAVVVSHTFYQIAVKIIMQRLFVSYGYYQLHEEEVYSSWNLAKNVRLIYKQEGWLGFFSGLLTRTIYELGITLLPRLLWWPLRSITLRSTVEAYFRASFLELYFLQCICENLLRCFSANLQLFARLTTLDIVNQMHDHPNLTKYPLLSLLRHHRHPHLHLLRPWSFLLSIHLIDAKLITNGLSLFLRRAN